MSKKTSVKISLTWPAIFLTLILVALKLTGYIDWSWLWVLFPIWIGWAYALSILAFAWTTIIFVAVIAIVVSIFER